MSGMLGGDSTLTYKDQYKETIAKTLPLVKKYTFLFGLNTRSLKTQRLINEESGVLARWSRLFNPEIVGENGENSSMNITYC